MNRRQFPTSLWSLGQAGAAPIGAATADSAAMPTQADGVHLKIAMLAHPDMTALDLVAPQLFFATLMRSDVQIVWKDLQPVRSDTGLSVLPTATFDDVPPALDLLFVPGGLKGTIALMRDQQVLDFLRYAAQDARYVTSVCTGSLLLGAAGLLRGYRATSHWYVRDLLPLAGAQPVNARIVRDRNRLTVGGVTAGIDLALEVASALRGDEYARMQQLIFEYDPQPRFQAGTPEGAGPLLTQRVLERRAQAIGAARVALAEAVGAWVQ